MRAMLKRVLTLALALIMVLGNVPFSALAAETDPAESARTVYLLPWQWTSDNARFAVYYWDENSASGWADMTALDDGYYMAEVPSDSINIIFVRMDPNKPDTNWEAKWNQTGDIAMPTSDNYCCEITGWNGGGADGKLCTHKDGTYPPTVPATAVTVSPNTGIALDPKKDAAGVELTVTVSPAGTTAQPEFSGLVNIDTSEAIVTVTPKGDPVVDTGADTITYTYTLAPVSGQTGDCWPSIQVGDKEFMTDLAVQLYHQTADVAATDSTCSTYGMQAHKYCHVCDTYFDTEGKETTKEALTLKDLDPNNHAPDYTASGAVLTAQCACGKKATVTLTAPAGDGVYNGQKQAYTLEKTGDTDILATLPDPVVTGDWTSADTHTVSLTVGNHTAQLEYTITQKHIKLIIKNQTGAVLQQGAEYYTLEGLVEGHRANVDLSVSEGKIGAYAIIYDANNQNVSHNYYTAVTPGTFTTDIPTQGVKLWTNDKTEHTDRLDLDMQIGQQVTVFVELTPNGATDTVWLDYNKGFALEAELDETGEWFHVTAEKCGGDLVEVYSGEKRAVLNVNVPCQLHFVAKTEPTCSQPGMDEHYACSNCDKMYRDAYAVERATENDLRIKELKRTYIYGKAATCEESGVIEQGYYKCENEGCCGKLYLLNHEDGTYTETTAEDVTIPALAHIWNDDGFCTRDASHYQPCVGTGEVRDPYQIANAGNLYWFAQKVNDGTCASAAAMLTGNITIPADAPAFTPIGTEANTFTGYFDGKDHTVSGLRLNGTDDAVGMFGYTSGGGIEDLILTGVDILRVQRNTGFVVGCANGTKLTNIRVTDSSVVYDGQISNSAYGGIAGTLKNGSMTDCHTSGITVSSATGSVDSAYAGGLAGATEGSSVLNGCSVTGCNLNLTYSGGLVGMAGGTLTVKNCFAVGTLSGTYSGSIAGGGLIRAALNVENSWVNCTLTGEVSGSIVGGFGGPDNYKLPTLNNCYIAETDLNVVGSHTEEPESGFTEVTAAQLASGEVTYALNGGKTQWPVWKQTLSSQSIPGFSGSTVYLHGNGDYSNDAPVPATDLTFSEDYLNLCPEGEKTLTVTVSPKVNTDVLTWQVADHGGQPTNGLTVTQDASDPTRFTVKSELLTDGNYTITFTIGSLKAEVSVSVACSKSQVQAKAATCTATGNKEYYVCSRCSAIYESDMVTKTTLNAVTVERLNLDMISEVPATCEATGTKAHYKCENTDCTCGGTSLFLSESDRTPVTAEDLVIKALDHAFDANGFCRQTDGEIHYQPMTSNGVAGVYKHYDITNAGQLYWFAQQVNLGAEKDLHGNLIPINGTLKNDITIPSDAPAWVPIGGANLVTEDWNYTGSFHGDNHTIANLTFAGTNYDCLGLFGRTDGARISNLTLKLGSVTVGSGTYSHFGTVVGEASNGTELYNISVSANIAVAPEYSAGGIVGHLQSSSLERCSFTGSLTGTTGDYVGGLVGKADRYAATATATVEDCYANATLSGSTVGGLLGSAEHTAITNCYAVGSFSGSTNTGALVGSAYTDTTATNCYGTMAANQAIGGGSIAGDGYRQINQNIWGTGSVTWRLNGETSENVVWHQRVPNVDPYPVLTGNAVVYHATFCNGTTPMYSNEPILYTHDLSATHPDDDMSKLVVKCTRCSQEVTLTLRLKGEHDLIYNGQPVQVELVADNSELAESFLAEGWNTLTDSDRIIPGEYTVTKTFANLKDISMELRFTIAKRPITVKADDRTIRSDDNWVGVSSDDYTITEGTLITGHKLTASVRPEDFLDSVTLKVMNPEIADAQGNDVTSCYNITCEPGTATWIIVPERLTVSRGVVGLHPNGQAATVTVTATPANQSFELQVNSTGDSYQVTTGVPVVSGDSVTWTLTITPGNVGTDSITVKLDKFSETIFVQTNHNQGNLIPQVNPTCTEPGMKAHYKCTGCDNVYDESNQPSTVEDLTIPAKGHSKTWNEEVGATCLAAGTVGHYHCSVCGKDMDEKENILATTVIPQLDHNVTLVSSDDLHIYVRCDKGCRTDKVYILSNVTQFPFTGEPVGNYVNVPEGIPFPVEHTLTYYKDGQALAGPPTMPGTYTVRLTVTALKGTEQEASYTTAGQDHYITAPFAPNTLPDVTIPCYDSVTVSQPVSVIPEDTTFRWKDFATDKVLAETYFFNKTYTQVGTQKIYCEVSYKGYTVRTNAFTVTVEPKPATFLISAIDPVPYNGKAQTPALKFQGIIGNEEMDVQWENNVNAGTATVTVTLKGNYSGTASQTFQILKADPDVTFPQGLTATYGDRLTDVELPRNPTGVFSFTQPDTAIDPTTQTVQVTFTFANPNYNTVTRDVPITVNKKAVTVSFPENLTRVYDGTTRMTVSGVPVEGLVGTDILSAEVTLTLDSADAGTRTATATQITLMGGNVAEYYTVSQSLTGTVQITPLRLTVKTVEVKGKLYDGTTDAAVKDFTMEFPLAQDPTVELVVTAKLDTPDSGTDKTVSLTYSLTGEGSENYTVFGPATATASVTPASAADLTQGVKDITPETVKPGDKEALEAALEALETQLKDKGITDEQKKALEDAKAELENLVGQIEELEQQAAEVSEAIEKLPAAVSPDSDSREDILKAKDAYDALSEDGKALISKADADKLADLVKALTDYKFTKGDGQTWTKGDLQFTTNGGLQQFTGIQVDGKAVDKAFYTAASGSTVITLKESYLATLAEGEHTITALYTDGKTSASFTVDVPEETTEPTTEGTTEATTDATTESATQATTKPADGSNSTTGDSFPLTLMLLLLVMSGAGILLSFKRKHYE